MDLNNPNIRTAIGAICGALIVLALTTASAKEKSAPRPILEHFGSFVGFIGLGLGGVFWSYYWWDQYHPETIGGTAALGAWLIVGFLGLAQPIALPYLVAKLFPREQFTLYLHEKSTDTWAYRIQVSVLIGMSLFSFIRIWQWVGTALGQRDLYQQFFSAFMIVALSVVVPSLMILDIIPKDWKMRLEISEYVERLKKKALAEQMLIESQCILAITELSIDPLQLAADQRQAHAQKVADILGPLLVRQNDAVRAIARIVAVLTRNQELRIKTPEDREIYEKLYELFQITDDRAQYRIKEAERVDIPQLAARQAVTLHEHAPDAPITRMKDLPREAAHQVINVAFDAAERVVVDRMQNLFGG